MALTPRDKSRQGCWLSEGANHYKSVDTETLWGLHQLQWKAPPFIQSSTLLGQNLLAWDPDMGTHRCKGTVLLVMVGHHSQGLLEADETTP